MGIDKNVTSIFNFVAGDDSSALSHHDGVLK